MRVLIMSQVRLFREGLAACLAEGEDVAGITIAADLGALSSLLAEGGIDIILIDVTQALDLEELRLIVADQPEIPVLAIGLREQREEVVRCGRAGFAGYVPREASLLELRQAMSDAAVGCLRCPAEIASGLIRALFQPTDRLAPAANDAVLTGREGEVLRLLGRGLSNKEIARELDLSVATVKHHVHNVLAKLGLAGRAQAMRRVREAPWIAMSG